MFKKKKVVGVPKKVIAKPAPVQEPVQAEEVEAVEQQGEEEDAEETGEELPKMPSPEPNPLSKAEVISLAETSMVRAMELLRYARTLK